MRRLAVAVFVFLFSLSSNASLTAPINTLAIRGGSFYTITHGILDGGILIIKDGKIAALGENIPIPRDARIIEASGLTIIPGFIDGFTNLSTADIVMENQDYDEASSPLTPHMQITDAINPENSFIPLARKTGITAVLCAPGEGNLLSGQSALILLKGRTRDRMIVKFPVAVHGNLGEKPKMRYGTKGRSPMTRMAEMALFRQTLNQAKEYLITKLNYEKKLKVFSDKQKKGQAKAEEKPQAPPVDFVLQSLIPVIHRDLPIIIRANRMDDVLSALRLAEEFQLNLILNHGTEAYRIADRLASRDIPVIVGPFTEDFQSFETSQAVAENAYILHKAGVKIAFQTGSYNHCTDLLKQARLAVSHGLPVEEALKALTLSPAQIFGVADRMGSLEKGKDANMVFFEGDPFSSLSRVKMVIIRGEIVEDSFRNGENND